MITRLKLTGMHCTSCAVNIDLTLEDLPGVKSSKTNFQKSETTLDFDPDKISLALLTAEIKKLGYQISQNS